MARLSLIVAMASNRVIGRDNAIPWRLPEDLRYFKATTLGHPIIMGRKTWDSIGRPLPGRMNIVVTRNTGFRAAGATVVGSLDEALAAAGGAEEVFLIGGAQLFVDALPRAHRIHLTELHRAFEGDTYFPLLPAFRWREVSRERHHAAPPNDFDFDIVIYENSSAVSNT